MYWLVLLGCIVVLPLRYKLPIAALLMSGFWEVVNAQKVSLSTNLLYWSTTTPNVGLDIKISRNSSVSLNGGFNPFKFSTKQSGISDTKVCRKLSHWSVLPEYRYWFCKSFERLYVGTFAMYGKYNIEGLRLFSMGEYRYKGSGAGCGLSFGYQWAIGGRLGLDAGLGLGYLNLKYDKFNPGKCGKLVSRTNKNLFGPIKANLSFKYYIR